jgi:hypothetical protein
LLGEATKGLEAISQVSFALKCHRHSWYHLQILPQWPDKEMAELMNFANRIMMNPTYQVEAILVAGSLMSFPFFFDP